MKKEMFVHPGKVLQKVSEEKIILWHYQSTGQTN
jgi:hypothetical protein